MWWKNYKYKVITGVITAAVLAVAFWYGGNAPGSQGWGVSGNIPESSMTSETPVDSGDSEAIVSEAATPSETHGSFESPSPSTAASPTSIVDDESAAEESIEPSEEIPLGAIQAEAPPALKPDSVLEQIIEIDPENRADKYQTDPVPEGKPVPVEPQDSVVGTSAYSCTISISCSTILNNMSYLNEEKWELVPENGWILEPLSVTFYEGESVFNVLQRTCKQQKIHMEFVNTPIYNSAYIEGMHNLYEFDVGEQSGWMYKVNGWFPNYGCSRYQLKDGDVIEWVYTCDLGEDVGGGYATRNES